MNFIFKRGPGLPDFSWYNLPKWGKYTYETTTKCTKWLSNIPKSSKIYPNGRFLVSKYTNHLATLERTEVAHFFLQKLSFSVQVVRLRSELEPRKRGPNS
jgi:hypothetical protein